MPFEDFDRRWRGRTGIGLADHVAKEAAQHGFAWDRDGFVTAVAANLTEGRFTLVVAVDEITAELRRIIEYLSAHTVGEVDVVALELGYVAEGDWQIIVPQAYGVELAERKSTAAKPQHKWDEASFLAALPGDSPSVGVARALFEWAAKQHIRVTTTTAATPVLAWQLDAFESVYPLFTADVRLEQLMLYFGTLKNRRVLEDPTRRAALVAALNVRFPIARDRADKYPTIPMPSLASPDAFEAFTSAWEDAIRDIRETEATERSSR